MIRRNRSTLREAFIRGYKAGLRRLNESALTKQDFSIIGDSLTKMYKVHKKHRMLKEFVRCSAGMFYTILRIDDDIYQWKYDIAKQVEEESADKVAQYIEDVVRDWFAKHEKQLENEQQIKRFYGKDGIDDRTKEDMILRWIMAYLDVVGNTLNTELNAKRDEFGQRRNNIWG